MAALPAADVGEALARPALTATQAELARAVLLGIARSGEQRLVAVGERGLVLLSDDAGAHWRQAQVPVSVTLTAVRFVGARGAAIGHGGVVLTSEDGGESWTLRLDGRRAAELALADAEQTVDANLLGNAQLLVEEGPDKPLLDLDLDEQGRLLVVGAYGMAFASEDFGQSWSSWMSRLENPSGYHLYAVRRNGEHLLVAGERGILLRSEDAGGRFSRVELPYAGSLFTAELLGERMVVAGLKGSLLYSRDGGQSWQRLDSGNGASFTASTQAADGALYLVDQAGQVFGWQQGKPVRRSSQPLPPLNAILSLDAQRFVLLSGLGGVLTLNTAEQEIRP
ncbi:hypothetical protein I0D68_15025 [Pseudomonas lalucatii]|nr:hypothetical protein [Pseudomonas lalucatii]QVM86907.1 hypothetical protein I0D68_15025 [Pseudomonas lalucatii]